MPVRDKAAASRAYIHSQLEVQAGDGPEEGVEQDAWALLMRKAQQGDGHAYDQLLRALVPLIRAMVLRRIYHPATVEDVTQDVLISLHQVRHTYDPSRPFLPWLSALVQARSIDALRKAGRRHRWELEDDQAGDQHPDMHAHRPAQSVEQAQQIQQLLDRLPRRQRRMVEWVHLEQMSLADAANASQLSLSAVKSILYRALQNLRNMAGRS